MSDKDTFRILPEHLTLLRNMYWRWDDTEFGAPAVDSKRPYGNSSVYSDLAEILGVKGEDTSNGYEELTEEQEAYLWKLHRETETVLEILISSGMMHPGLYQNGFARAAQWMRVAD